LSDPTRDESKSVESLNDESETLFTYDEVARLVKDFILAYTEGRIKIDFPTVESIKYHAELRGEKVSDKDAVAREMDSKSRFNKSVGVIAGESPSTKTEYQATVRSLFSTIVAAQQGNRISGDFSGASAQERIDVIEKRLNATNHLVEQLVRWIRDLSGV
jgi:hypothetical protein